MMQQRFSRTALLLGADALETLAQAHVAVFGLGGVGGYAAEALARSGVGSLTLVDHDAVSPTNVNRQIVALESTIGQGKAAVMADRVRDINPACRVEALRCFYLPDTADEIDLARFDYVVDAVDTVTAKLLLAQRAQETATPIISSMGTANKLDPTLLKVGDIGETSICPLAKIIRKECRKRGIRDLQVLWSDEQPLEVEGKRDAIDEHGFVREGHSILGTMSYFPPIMGQMIAGYVIRQLAELG